MLLRIAAEVVGAFGILCSLAAAELIGMAIYLAAPYLLGSYDESHTDRYLFEAFNQYAYAHVGWDTSIDPEKFMSAAYAKLFGAGAPALIRVFGLCLTGAVFGSDAGAPAQSAHAHETSTADNICFIVISFCRISSSRISPG